LTSSPTAKVTDLAPPSILPEPKIKPTPLVKPDPQTRKRAQTRNQYTQRLKFPSPSSPLIPRPTEPLSIRRKAPPLKLELTEAEGGGTITELRILLLRDAAVYGPIVHRLIHGTFPAMAMQGRKKGVEVECIWLGMESFVEELSGAVRKKESLVLKGGEGYI